MADGKESPNLKRKREGADSHRKKIKTQRRSSAGVQKEKEDEQAQGTIATPVAISEEKKSNKTLPNSAIAATAVSADVSNQPIARVSNESMAQEQTPSKHARNKKRRNRNKNKNTNESGGEEIQAAGTSLETHAPEMPTENTAQLMAPNPSIQENGISTNKSKGKRQKSKSSSWSVSATLGGWFLPKDPVYTSDEGYIIVANNRALQVYSAETSLLASVLPVGAGFLSAYALSSSRPNCVYIANSAGLISLWDWAEGKKVARWDIGTNVRQIEVVSQAEPVQDLVYCHEVGTSHIINVHALRTREQDAQTELKQVLKTKSSICGFQVLLQGKLIVASTRDSVLVGKRSKIHKTALQDYEYVWREFRTALCVTSIDAFVRTGENPTKGKNPQQDVRDHIDLAVGYEDGVINVFEDVLSSLSRLEKGGNKADADLESLKPKRLHWHREAVHAVKWSRDGNYLVSGGEETVLVLWQLSTGKQQHLPHLTATIERIVVSPSGTSYAISLANNSVVVLSTSELEAKTNIVGIHSRRVDLEQLPRISGSRDYSFDIFSQVPLTVNPKKPNEVLFATPSSQPHGRQRGVDPEPYLQTFDLATQRPILRQPLTRNNATDPNMGPNGTRILEPSIKFLQISSDGKWLASVDEWVPPQADMGHLDEGIPDFNEEERSFRREVYLKFWRWNDKTAQWMLESRVDAPHSFPGVGAHARVLYLIDDPSSAGFATVGEDRIVQIWKPKTRMRDGTIVRGANKNSGEGLVTWSAERSIKLSGNLDVLGPNPSSQDSIALRVSRLAFSSDGSVLVVGVSWASGVDTGVIHIIDAITGTIRRSITELDMTSLSNLGVTGHYLVTVGNAISVWDLVLDELVYSVPIQMTGVKPANTTPLVRLALSPDDDTFAVSYPQFEQNEQSKSRVTRHFKKASSKVSIFDLHQPQATWTSTLPDVILAMSPAKSSSGYILLDSSASIKLLTPKAATVQLITPPPEPLPGVNTFEPVEESPEVEDHAEILKDAFGALAGSEDILRNAENDKPVVRSEDLQRIFDVGASHTQPSVKDLLHAVVGLYARKPKAMNTD